MLQEPCSTPLMKPRERIGHCSIAKAAPAGHSAPMPIPSRVRNTNRNMKLGEKPAMKLHSEYQAIEIISGVLRPIRSANHPAAVAPKRRIHKVNVNTMVTAVSGTLNSCPIGTMISRKIVKSKASSVQPDRKSTRLNSSHSQISYAVFCLKKKKKKNTQIQIYIQKRRCTTSQKPQNFQWSKLANVVLT